MRGLNAIDLFAGPGGWDYACRVLGIDPLGIEWDDAACATREAAGLRTVQGDVSEVDVLATASEVGGAYGAAIDLLIASPPCPTFSSAGKGDGIADMPLVYEAATAAARGKPVPELPWRDERSALVVEPLRWAVLLEPRFLAWEQVPPVLPFWEHCAELLRAKGWNVWTGIMEAERYGVPQTRERAILIADREAPVHPPRPTHQRYVKGEPQRHEVTLEGEILPWVSMAEALGWDVDDEMEYVRGTGMLERHGERPARRADEPSFAVLAGSKGSGPRLKRKFRNGNQMNAAVRDEDAPAPTIHFGKAVNQVEWINEHGKLEEVAECGCFVGWIDADGFCTCCHAHLNDPDGLYAQQGDGSHSYSNCPANQGKVVYDRRQSEAAGVRPRQFAEAAPTICGAKLGKGVDVWAHERPAPTLVTTRRSDKGILVGRQLPEGEGRNVGGRNWPTERPSTTVNGDPRISKPGRHDPDESGSQQKDAIRVSLEEAAILQSFPPDYPFQGTKSKRFEQVGNAVPPLLAHAVLAALLAPVLLVEGVA